MLAYGDFYSIFEIFELLVNFDDFLEVQFFKVDVHSSYEEVDEIALFQFIISKTSQCFQYFGDLSVEIVEGCYFRYALSVLFQKWDVVSNW